MDNGPNERGEPFMAAIGAFRRGGESQSKRSQTLFRRRRGHRGGQVMAFIANQQAETMTVPGHE